MSAGFIIKELKLLSTSAQPATVTFEKGLNVITGPSNTGKTYIYQCINYMLGSSTRPKPIKHALDYESIVLKILSADGKLYTLQSDLKGGDFIVSSANAEPLKLARKHSKDSNDTISGFLLELNNLAEKKIRTNAKGKTRKISYRDIVKYLMVDEARIITDKSPILSGQYTSATEEKSTFKLILSGRDDSDIIENLSKDEIKYRKGKVEMLNELITTNSLELNQLEDSIEPQDRLIKVDLQIEQLKTDHDKLKDVFNKLDQERVMAAERLSQVNNKKIYNDEILIRSEILKQQYNTDSRRLNSTIEASYLLMNNPSLEENCPVCETPLSEKDIEPELKQVIDSCGKEIVKIVSLIKEVIESETLLAEENTAFISEIAKQQEILKAITDQINLGVAIQMEEIFKQISELNGLKANLNKAIFLKDKIQSFENQKLKILSSLDKKGDENNFEDLLTSRVFDLSNVLNSILVASNYPDISGVTFSETSNDFVISGEDRELAGKGYRAITYASFLIALQELLFNKNYSIGPSILDSPLVTYRKPSAQDEGITVDLAMDFYRYLATNEKVPQVIILENEEPPSDISHLINHITFTQNLTSGRYGFIPLPSGTETTLSD
jgi:hypothetical protein